MSDFQHAQLDWDEQGQPLSRVFGDIYFSSASGIDETHHVFLAANDLPQRFATLPAGGRLHIGETGFGTGLNFLCAWQLFERCAPTDARLHFVSVEKYPLTQADLRRALALWPELAPLAAQLLEQYVAVHPGFQRFNLAAGRITLTLLVGDALDYLPTLDARIDAWFLDGFAPAKNPDMWSGALFAQLARLSAPGASLATFTAAGFVRRGLKEAGFTIRRIPGFGKKWEMSRGRFEGKAQDDASPWYARPRFVPPCREALVIGAGLAGCASAASLAARGWRVTLLERHDAPAQEASGNPQGVLYLKLSAHGTVLSQLILSGFGHTRRLLQRLKQGRDWQACGVLQLAFDSKEAERQAKLAEVFPSDLLRILDKPEAQALAGVALPTGGLFYPQAGWVHPPALCQLLIDHPNIHLIPHSEALELHRENEHWCARAEGRVLARAPITVLAGAVEILRFPQTNGLRLKRIRGQISRLPATAESMALTTVLCAEGYVAPPRDGEHTVGASFDFHNMDLEPTDAEHAGNLQLLEAISADLGHRLRTAELAPQHLEGRVALRCTSSDYLPIVGPLADSAAFAERYAVLAKDARQMPDISAPWLDGLYINSAHGSRGLITAPLSGELLAAWLDDEPLPVPRAVAEACHPNRFALRRLIRAEKD